jgi:type I restriction enzyme M protein
MEKTIFQIGIEKGLIKINIDETSICYVHQNVTRNYSNPEEKVQSEAFLKLVILYNYPVEQIRQFVKVQMGSETKEADIIVYSDMALMSPHIIVECKKTDISELEFQRAIEQCFSYAIAEGASYTWTTSGIKDAYFSVPKEKPKQRETIADIPVYGVKKLPNYKFAKNGGTTRDGQKLFDLSQVTQSELTDKFKQAHQALWGGGELNPSEAFDELDKLIFCKIYDEKKKRKTGDPYDFQIIKVAPENDSEESMRRADLETSKNLLNRLVSLYDEGKTIGERKNDPEIFKDGIKLNATKVRSVVGYLEGVDLLNTDLDSKGRAFETFMGSFFRGDFGQYFTPRNIVQFIVDSLRITENHRVLDTSCGSGGFLLHALDKVRKDAREFYNIKEGEVESVLCHKQWHDFAEHSLFGIEINEQIARTAKMNMIIHDDGHTNVVASDGLISPEQLRENTGNQGFKEASFDLIITNPPFGSTVKQTEKAYLHQYNLATKDVDWLNPNSKQAERPSQSTEVLFIEQAQRYLADDGILAIVLPDGILTNSSMQYVRNWISENFRILAVVSLPQTAFTSNGAGVKSSVLFLRKYCEEKKQLIVYSKESLQTAIKESELGKQLSALFFDKKQKLAELNKQLKKESNEDKIEGLVLKKQELSDEIDEKIETTKELMQEMFEEKYKAKVTDYAILMAIANDIGYDATGKEIQNNDLIQISEELSKFIKAVNDGKDDFFL